MREKEIISVPSYCLLQIVDGLVGHASVIWVHLKSELDEVEKGLLPKAHG